MNAMRIHDDDAKEEGGDTPLSVSALAAKARRLIEGIGHVRVRGEVGRVSQPRSGHRYFALKDADAQLECVLWRSRVTSALDETLREGAEVVCHGTMTAYAPQSRYQLNVAGVEAWGEGVLRARLEALRKALRAEGLFDAAHKKPLPRAPSSVGIISSVGGAALRDVLTQLPERMGLRVLVWPVSVQGPNCPGEVVAALRGLARGGEAWGGRGDEARGGRGGEARGGTGWSPPEVIVLTRGGGSMEDLLGFSSEEVARAVFASPIPVISAIGHEVDRVLTDDCADVRAETPTAAGRLLGPLRREVEETLSSARAVLERTTRRALTEARRRLGAARVPSTDTALGVRTQRLDGLTERWARAPLAGLGTNTESLAALERRWARAPLAGLGTNTESLAALERRLARAPAEALKVMTTKLAGLARQNALLSHEATLKRGFVLARLATGALARSPEDLPDGTRFEVDFGADKRKQATAGRH